MKALESILQAEISNLEILAEATGRQERELPNTNSQGIVDSTRISPAVCIDSSVRSFVSNSFETPTNVPVVVDSIKSRKRSSVQFNIN